MSEDNLYSAPASARFEPETGYGSVEKGLAGDYEFRIGDVLSDSWAGMNGHKLMLNIASGVAFLVALAFMGVSAAVSLMVAGPEVEPFTTGSFVTLPIDLLFYAVYGVMTTGFIVMGAKISMGVPTRTGELFRFMNRLLRALLTYILMTILVVIGYLLLILPGIYLTIAYLFAIPLAVEKNMSPWQALETSRKTVTHKWFAVFGLMLVMSVLMVLGALTLGIAYFWLVPMFILTYGITYRNLFGLERETLSS